MISFLYSSWYIRLLVGLGTVSANGETRFHNALPQRLSTYPALGHVARLCVSIRAYFYARSHQRKAININFCSVLIC